MEMLKMGKALKFWFDRFFQIIKWV